MRTPSLKHLRSSILSPLALLIALSCAAFLVACTPAAKHTLPTQAAVAQNYKYGFYLPLIISPSVEARIAVGAEHMCAVTPKGGVQCWGANQFGQLGIGKATMDASLAPVDVVGIEGNVRTLAAGTYHTCAATYDGKLYCWGLNHNSQVVPGYSSNPIAPRPEAISNLGFSAVRQIAAGDSHTCVLTEKQQVYCWGTILMPPGDTGQGRWNYPQLLASLEQQTIELVAGLHHTCALLEDGDVKCWGMNDVGQLGDLVLQSNQYPVDVPDLKENAKALAAGGNQSCAMIADSPNGYGQLICWGEHTGGDLHAYLAPKPLYAPVRNTRWLRTFDAMKLAAGWHHRCNLAPDNARIGVECVGSNEYGQLGNGERTTYESTSEISTLTPAAAAIIAGPYHTCVQSKRNEIWCWGDEWLLQHFAKGRDTAKPVFVTDD